MRALLNLLASGKANLPTANSQFLPKNDDVGGLALIAALPTLAGYEGSAEPPAIAKLVGPGGSAECSTRRFLPEVLRISSVLIMTRYSDTATNRRICASCRFRRSKPFPACPYRILSSSD